MQNGIKALNDQFDIKFEKVVMFHQIVTGETNRDILKEFLILEFQEFAKNNNIDKLQLEVGAENKAINGTLHNSNNGGSY